MNKTLIVVSIILFLIISWLISFIDTLHRDVDVKYGFDKNDHSKKITTNYKLNAYGDEVLILNELTINEKKIAWKNSIIKEEMLKLFPKFSEMTELVDERVEDDNAFKERLLNHILEIEQRYISGIIDGQSAKTALSSF